MSIFPSDYGINRNTVIVNNATEKPRLLKSFNIDTDTGDVVIKSDGTFEEVEGLDAIKVRVWIVLNMRRDRWYMISKDVGNRLKDLQGKTKDYVVRNIDHILTEALVDDIYITSITINSVNQVDDICKISFVVNSIYGNYEEETDV